MIRILQIVPNMQVGGIETWLMNQYRTLDRAKIQYDFLVHYQKHFFYDDEIENLGGRIYRCSFREDNNIVKYIKFLNRFFKEHTEYKIVHGHMPSFSFLFMGAAKRAGVPVRISHSHNTSFNKTFKGYLEYGLTKLVRINSNYLFACSNLAGQYMYGKSKFRIIHNAIDLQKFRYQKEVRQKVREELGIENNLVIGHIGRFNLQKNHKFILRIFRDVHKKCSTAILLLIGTGELYNEIRNQAKAMNLLDSIKFLGIRDDVNRLYQAMDVFVLPSNFEGLPVVGIEAQTSGIKTLISSNVTKEVKVINNTLFLPINRGTKPWVDEILAKNKMDRESAYMDVKTKGYDINDESMRIQQIYTTLYNNGAIEISPI